MERSTRLTPLDSLRGLAAIGVAFFWHYQHFQPQNGYPFSEIGYWFYNYGWNLVDFFFVLSGYIFSYVYKGNIASGGINLKDYVVLRISRLYPLHFATLIIVTMLQALRNKVEIGYFIYQYNDFYHFTLNALFMQGGWFEKGWSFNAPTWSVSSEIVAYILFFLIIRYFLVGKKYLFLYIGFMVLGLIVVLNKMEYPILNEKIGRVLIGFFVGCIAYEINILINKLKLKNIAVSFVSIVFVGTIYYLIYIGHQTSIWHLIYTILIYPSIIIFVLNINILYKILSIKYLVYLGDISYSLYLWHFPVQLIIKTLDDIFLLNINYSSISAFVMFVLITIVFSIVSFEFIEKPISNILRKYFIAKRKVNFKNEVEGTP